MVATVLAIVVQLLVHTDDTWILCKSTHTHVPMKIYMSINTCSAVLKLAKAAIIY